MTTNTQLNRRTTKEYKLLNLDNTKIRSKYGTLDRNRPEILYIRSRANVTPSVRKKDFSDDIIFIKKSFEKEVKSIILNSNSFENKHICSIEMSENGIAYGKKSHMKYDVYIKPVIKKELNEYETDVRELVLQFNDNLSYLLSKNDIVIK